MWCVKQIEHMSAVRVIDYETGEERVAKILLDWIFDSYRVDCIGFIPITKLMYEMLDYINIEVVDSVADPKYLNLKQIDRYGFVYYIQSEHKVLNLYDICIAYNHFRGSFFATLTNRMVTIKITIVPEMEQLLKKYLLEKAKQRVLCST